MTRIAHLWADTGIEDEVLTTFGDVTRVGKDPDPNPFSDVVQADARDPPLSGTFDLVVCHPPCQKFSKATGDHDRDEYPNHIPDARRVASEIGQHHIIENVPQAPLQNATVLTGRHFGLPIRYPRAFETSFHVPEPPVAGPHRPSVGPLSSQGKPGNAWVGSTDSWRLAKGYGHDWPGRALKRHAVPTPYLRHLLYYWMAARDGDSIDQQTLTGGFA